MSGSHGQSTPARVRKSSPNAIKQGPMKATIPISSVLKNSSSLKSSSPSSSPTLCCWKARISPDQPSGQRSPGSSVYKVKSKTLEGLNSGAGSVIRRTASLDTIYLKGQWPRDTFYLHSCILQVDKATQTESADMTDFRKFHSIIENSDEKLEKLMIRQRLQHRNNKDFNGKLGSSPYALVLPSAGSQTNTSYKMSPVIKASPINIPVKPLPKSAIRSSVEGLNQEIEKLVLKSALSGSHIYDRSEEYEKFCQAKPEGHRAPLAELLKATRSIDTQTPAGGEITRSCSSGPPSRNSNSPLIPDQLDSSSEAGDSQNSSPDQETSKLGTSPHINRFLAREPPDGCEKVHLKSLDEQKGLMVDRSPRPCTFQLKPSLGSAFQLLQPASAYTSTTERDLPMVPSQNDLI